jgi:transposase
MTADIQGDTCDRMLSNAKSADGLSQRQRRFLDAYRQGGPVVAPAARLAGVHRATVYRWLADSAFADAMRAAADAFFRDHREKVMAAEAERQRWREERERERRPMRCFYLARARAAKRR